MIKLGIKCPVCGEIGDSVSVNTVKSLVQNENIDVENQYFSICRTKDCAVVYYSKEQAINQDDVKVSVWFKDNAEPKILCYCSNKSEDDILRAVIDIGEKDIGKILKATGVMSKCECETHNPTGKCCLSTVKAFIETIGI